MIPCPNCKRERCAYYPLDTNCRCDDKGCHGNCTKPEVDETAVRVCLTCSGVPCLCTPPPPSDWEKQTYLDIELLTPHSINCSSRAERCTCKHLHCKALVETFRSLLTAQREHMISIVENENHGYECDCQYQYLTALRKV